MRTHSPRTTANCGFNRSVYQCSISHASESSYTKPTHRRSPLSMHIDSHNHQNMQTIQSRIHQELNKELEIILPNRSTHPRTEVVHSLHTPPRRTTVMRAIRFPIGAMRAPLRFPIHLRYKDVFGVKHLHARRVSICGTICARILCATYATSFLSVAHVSLLRVPVAQGGWAEGNVAWVRERDVQQS